MSESCHETAFVTGLDPIGRALVTVRRAEACHSCASKGACTALGGQTQDFTMVVDNTISATAGDEVLLSMSEGSVIKASAVLYLLPALGLIGGALSGHFMAPSMGFGQDPTAIVGAVVGICAGLLIAKLTSNVLVKNKEYVPRLTAIVSRSSSE